MLSGTSRNSGHFRGDYQSFFSKADYLVDAVALDKYTVELTVPLNSGHPWWRMGSAAT